MPKDDPYEPSPPYKYECLDCGHRVEADTYPGKCPECGGEMLDVSVPQE